MPRRAATTPASRPIIRFTAVLQRLDGPATRHHFLGDGPKEVHFDLEWAEDGKRFYQEVGPGDLLFRRLFALPHGTGVQLERSSGTLSTFRKHQGRYRITDTLTVRGPLEAGRILSLTSYRLQLRGHSQTPAAPTSRANAYRAPPTYRPASSSSNGLVPRPPGYSPGQTRTSAEVRAYDEMLAEYEQMVLGVGTPPRYASPVPRRSSTDRSSRSRSLDRQAPA